MSKHFGNNSVLSSSKMNMSKNRNYASGGDQGNNERMVKLADKLTKISSAIENEKNSKYEQYENKIMNLYNSIEETREGNVRKFNDVKDQILVLQKTIEDESLKKDSAHNEFMEFMKKMEEKIFEKFDFELNSKREIEMKVAHYLEEKFNTVKGDLQRESKTRFDSIENLELYFEKELPKIQEGFKIEQTEREENDNINISKLTEDIQRINSMIGGEKKTREETQEGILEMIKIMNERMKNDLTSERKEREQNEEVLIELLENTCNRLQQTTAKI